MNFFFWPLASTLSPVPLNSRERPFSMSNARGLESRTLQVKTSAMLHCRRILREALWPYPCLSHTHTPILSFVFFSQFVNSSLFFNISGADSFVNVVVFSEEARVLMPNTTTLVRANSDNVDELVDLVQNLEVRYRFRGMVVFVQAGIGGSCSAREAGGERMHVVTRGQGSLRN